MDAFVDFFPDLLVVAALLLAAIALAPVAQRLWLPGPAAFLLVGVVAGTLDVFPTDGLSALTLEEIGAIALYLILFQGGLATGFSAWRRQARAIVLLGLPGTALTAACLALVGHYVLGLSWALAALAGVALSPTDPAAVYATLRGGSTTARARTILEGESGFNDPVGIALMVVVVAYLSGDEASVGEGAIRFGEELAIGVAGGLVGAVLVTLLLRATGRLEESLQSVTVLAMAVAVGAGTASLHGSGFLAVYVCGLLAADRWAEQDGRHHAIPEASAAASEPVLFGLLGAVYATTVEGIDVVHGIVLTLVTMLAVRPLVTAILLAGTPTRRAERLVVSVGGLKGAVPLLLAAYPALEHLEEARRTEAIVLVATAVSIAVQGAMLSTIAHRAGRSGRGATREPTAKVVGASSASVPRLAPRSRRRRRPFA